MKEEFLQAIHLPNFKGDNHDDFKLLPSAHRIEGNLWVQAPPRCVSRVRCGHVLRGKPAVHRRCPFTEGLPEHRRHWLHFHHLHWEKLTTASKHRPRNPFRRRRTVQQPGYKDPGRAAHCVRQGGGSSGALDRKGSCSEVPSSSAQKVIMGCRCFFSFFGDVKHFFFFSFSPLLVIPKQTPCRPSPPQPLSWQRTHRHGIVATC